MSILETDNKRTTLSFPNYPKPQSRVADKIGFPFEDQFKCAEIRTRKKFIGAINVLSDATLPEWLARLLERKILPPLKRIGFEPELSRALFNMASPAWERMGPIGPKAVYFHPALMRELADISQGYLNTAMQNTEKQLLLATMNSRDRFHLVENSMDPSNLFHMLEDVATSWIILPRAYGHLKIQHARWLPGYLAYLEKEGRSEFANILMRVVTEFVGNFAHKFSRRVYSQECINDVLFYGYAAMFWKNLRSPPEGIGISGLFENFLRWTQLFCKRYPPISADKSSLLAIMDQASKILSAGDKKK